MPDSKVAILRIPANEWNTLTPQAQMLAIMQQMLGFMASEFFGDMEGLQVQLIADTQSIAKYEIVFQVGKNPGNGLINVN